MSKAGPREVRAICRHGRPSHARCVDCLNLLCEEATAPLRAECASLKAHAEALAKTLRQISIEADAATLHKWDAPLMGLQNAIEDGDAAFAAYRKDFP